MESVMPNLHQSVRDPAEAQASADLRERVTSTAERLSSEVAGLLNVLSSQSDEAASIETVMIARKKHKGKHK